MTEGNQKVDQFISFASTKEPLSTLQQAQQSHAILHQNASMVQFPSLTHEQTKQLIRACPIYSTLLPLGPNTGINPHRLKANHIWQTDITHVAQFGTLKYVQIMVDIYSGAIFATAHTGEATKHVTQHLPAAFATLGIPKSTYTSKKFQEFCNLWYMTHNAGISYNTQGQAIVERQHQRIKNQLIKITKGDYTPRSPHTQLHLVLLTLNFFSIDNQSITPMEKHFDAWNTCPPVRVLWKNLETNTWQGPDPLLTTGQGYACVFP
jgi:transposase InsO family protein